VLPFSDSVMKSKVAAFPRSRNQRRPAWRRWGACNIAIPGARERMCGGQAREGGGGAHGSGTNDVLVQDSRHRKGACRTMKRWAS
jgi:hypothetical protein